MTDAEIRAAADRALFAVYDRFPVTFVRGRGARLWDADGRSYLDFFSSLAVTNLGHCHPRVVAALRAQAESLFHASNLHYSLPQTRLAELLVRHSFADRVFLCNSGAEANEGAIKLARRHGAPTGRYEVLTALGSFHGRTLATLTATGQERVRSGFEPLPPGFRHVPYDDPAATEAAISPQTIAVMVEPIQGEGGIIVPRPDYLSRLRSICDRHGLLLIVDAVQVGLGRTGSLFGYEQAGTVPDVLTLAKALGNGVPIGAVLAREQVAAALGRGAHASTFGGNALACAAAVATMETLVAERLPARAAELGGRLRRELEALARDCPRVREVRGQGLLAGVQLAGGPARAVVEACLAEGLVTGTAGPEVLRLLPPLVLSDTELDEGLAILREVLLR